MSAIQVTAPAALDVSAIAATKQPLFFSVSALKLIVLSTCTFGLYEIYWFYRNWQLIKHHEQSDIWPAARSIFGTIFCYSLFRRVRERALAESIPAPSAGALAVCWIVGSLLYKLPDPYWLVCFLAVLLLLPVQAAMNAINAKHCPDYDRNSRFTAWNIVAIVLGGMFFLLSLYGTVFLQDAA
jgi:hypothetical protein